MLTLVSTRCVEVTDRELAPGQRPALVAVEHCEVADEIGKNSGELFRSLQRRWIYVCEGPIRKATVVRSFQTNSNQRMDTVSFIFSTLAPTNLGSARACSMW